MRRIVTADVKKKKDTRNKIILGVFMVGLMVFSVAGYAFFSGDDEEGIQEETKYNGVKFLLGGNGLWYFNLQNIDFLAQYSPQETENITLPYLNLVNSYSGKPLFFLGQGDARQEIERNLWSIISRVPQDGCIEDYEDLCEEEAPIKNCSKDNVIIIQEKNETSIIQEDNCVFISAPYEEQARVADAFIFKILGIRSV